MSGKSRIPLLIVEDDPGLQAQLRWCFEDYEVHIAGTRAEALDLVRTTCPPVVTLDLGLPPDPANASEGLAALAEILELAPHTKVIVVTGNDDRDNAVAAVAAGAYDFYQKPVDPDILGMIIDRAYHLSRLEQEHRDLVSGQASTALGSIMTASDKMLAVCRTVEKVAPSDVTVTILGESGTGKELVARAIHENSPRRDGPFVAINCAAIPENLLESELFGYEKGAFTGAAKQTRGKIEYADGGTFFLDELGDLPAPLQAKMLRFLQERVIERVGGRKEIPVDVRVVCATHRDLQELISSGQFREDLYYRLCEISLTLPPLRERAGDIAYLARRFLERLASELGRQVRGFDREALAALEAYSWPGNVRELENRIKRAIIMCEGDRLGLDDLDLPRSTESDEDFSINLKEIRDHAERTAVSRALAMSNNNIKQAAELLGVSRPTLYDLKAKFGM